MHVTIDRRSNSRVAVAPDTQEHIITDVQSAMDLMALARENECDKLLLYKNAICSEFFQLHTGLAGEILQKYTNYHMRIAIVGDFENVQSKSLRDFIRESNKGGRVMFLGSTEQALDRLHSDP